MVIYNFIAKRELKTTLVHMKERRRRGPYWAPNNGLNIWIIK